MPPGARRTRSSSEARNNKVTIAPKRNPATCASHATPVDTTANCLFVLASARGFLSIVSVLGSLYPVVTVLAAHVVLGERISRMQRWGIALALAGVAVVASG